MVFIEAEPYSRRVIGCAIEVHKVLGPGLMESVYEACLCDELARSGLGFVRQRRLPVVYKGQMLDVEFRADLIVEDSLIVEVKAVQAVHPVHEAQLHTYLKLSGIRVGLILNFNEVRLVEGVRRRLL
ncbi:MAG TPA: GxxExxY protein [Rhodopila sp.]|nr:GxxExxY protein [Rhodopila sp.]